VLLSAPMPHLSDVPLSLLAVGFFFDHQYSPPTYKPSRLRADPATFLCGFPQFPLLCFAVFMLEEFSFFSGPR